MTVESNKSMGAMAAALFATGVISQIVSFFDYLRPSSSIIAPSSLAASGILDLVSVFSFVGLILFFVAMHGFSKDYGEPKIFSHLILGFVIAIVAGIIALIIVVANALQSASTLFPGLGGFNFTAPYSPAPTPSQAQISSVVTKTVLPFLPVASVIALAWIIFNVLAINLLGDKSKLALFKTGAKILLAGALITVAVSVAAVEVASIESVSFNYVMLAYSVPGGLVQNVAWGLLAFAYLRIQAPPPATSQPTIASPVAPLGQVKYCTKCGTPNKMDALFCERCGQKQ